MILLIDNYDSFSYNLYQLIGTLTSDIKVIRNDEMTVEEIEALNPAKIILSPGPKTPSEAGVCEDVVRRLAGKIPILGVCLGHQAICEVYGATVTHAKRLMHGKKSISTIRQDAPIFKGLTEKIEVARYHSLAAKADTIPDCLEVIATADDDGEVMAVRHKQYSVYGLQFHPESILTPMGISILKNFLQEGRMMIKETISKVAAGQDLSYQEAYDVVDEIMSGETSQAQTAALLTALHGKGETPSEIAGAAAAMRDKATPVEHHKPVLEIVGTGGDKAQSMNVSTTTAFLVAADGIAVAKHGNRAATSKSGTADALEALGGNLMVDPEQNTKMLDENNFCFMFAQKYHSAMRFVGPVRKDIGIQTIFNILGPLTNPTKPDYFLLGVYKEELVLPVAETLKQIGAKRAMVVFGQDVLDEISVSAKTTVAEFAEDGVIHQYEIDPADYGIPAGYTRDDIAGGTPDVNAGYTKQILANEMTGAKREVVLLNAAAAIHIAKQIPMKEAYKEAEEVMASKKALDVIDKYVKLSNEQ